MRRTHLFYRRHYEAIGRALGNAYYHVRSRIGEQTLDLVVGMLIKVFQVDSADTFDAYRWKAFILQCADEEGREDDPDRDREREPADTRTTTIRKRQT